MKILVVQNKVFKDIELTLESINNLLQDKLVNNPDFIIFPEMFTTPYDLESISKYKQISNSVVIDFLKKIAKNNDCYVVGGTIPYFEDGKIYNSCFIIDKQGFVIDRYDKIHLFEITYPNGEYFSEAEVLSKGNRIVTFNTDYGKFGVMVCFDIRFPLLASKIMEDDVLAIFVPGAFNTYTGPKHWRTTFRARAIDNQLFMIGCSPSTDSFGNYNYYGHSIIVNPMGEILKELDETTDAFMIDIDLKEVEKSRNELPILKNRVKL